MEERYEIRGKIGQGGLGSVHRAYDHKMMRQVAIKRILTSTEDQFLEVEATRQILAEVGALASLQHPHIVTVYDVGEDEEGPYVVMELIDGKTLDEIIENAPLTWHDFKILAMQSLEALIAAQELNMIHSDLKPPNIMLTWLPSGAFQVKIVDFGLATLIHNQSQEEIEKMEAIYGSVFFVPPEQYERKTLDTRSDLYSLGCCFYQSLTGTYPFNGSTGMEVMQAHLNHTVTPIQEIRGDIPLWACDWIMWLINRFPDDRPPSASDALTKFVHDDKESNPITSRVGATVKQPRLIIPSTLPSITATGLVPLKQKTSVVNIAAAPTSQHNLHETANILTASIPEASAASEKQKLSKKVRVIALLAIGVSFLVVTGLLVKKRNDGIVRKNAYNTVVNMAAERGVKEIPINGALLKIILDVIAESPPETNLKYTFAALTKARATDGTDIDAVIAEFITTAALPGGIRDKLFEEVVMTREGVTGAPILIKFIATAKNDDEALAAINAIRHTVREEHAEGLLNIIATTEHSTIRQAAEWEMRQIIVKSKNLKNLTDLISRFKNEAGNSEVSQSFSSLLEQCKPKTNAPVQTPSPKTEAKVPTPIPQTVTSSVRLVVPTSFNYGCDTYFGSTSIVDQNTGRTEFLHCTLPGTVEKNPLLIYLKFHLIEVDISAMGSGMQVGLQMYNSDTKSTGVHTVKIFGLNNVDNLDMWADHTLDHTNAPAISDRSKLMLDPTKITELGTLKVDFDQLAANAPLPIFTSAALTDFLKTDTDQRVTLVIRTESISAGGSPHFGIRSREFFGGSRAPALIFTAQSKPNQTVDAQKVTMTGATSDDAAKAVANSDITVKNLTDGTWLGNGSAWNVAGAWSGGVIADGVNSTANFTNVDITSNVSMDLGADRTIGNIIFTDDKTASHDLTLSGKTLTLDVSTGSPAIDVTQAERRFSIASIIAGSKGMLKKGAGTLMLSGNNTYTGPTIINSGILMISNSVTSIGSGNLTINGGVLEAYWGLSLTRTLGPDAGQIQLLGGASGFSQNGSNQTFTMIFNNANYEIVWGSDYFKPSVLALQTPNSQGSANASISNKIDLNGATRTVQVEGGTTGAAAGTLAGVIRNSSSTPAGLVKTGAGRINLNAANTYNGGTTLQEGTIQLGDVSGLGSSVGTLTVNGGLLNIYGQSNVTVGNLTGTGGTIANNSQYLTDRTFIIGNGGGTGGNFQGAIVNNTDASARTLALTKTGTGTITLSGANTYTGNTAVTAGTLLINGNQSSASGNVSVSANATLGGTGIIGGNTTIAANGKLEFNLSTAAASHDKLELATSKSLAFSGASVLTITSSGGVSPGSYTLLTAPGGITGVAPATLTLPAGWVATVGIVGNDLVLKLTSAGGR